MAPAFGQGAFGEGAFGEGFSDTFAKDLDAGAIVATLKMAAVIVPAERVAAGNLIATTTDGWARPNRVPFKALP